MRHKHLLSPARKSYFDYWEQRLREELGSPDAGFAMSLLEAIAADDTGATRQTLASILSSQVNDPEQREALLRYLLDILISDGYIVQQSGRFVFRSMLLRDFWRTRLT